MQTPHRKAREIAHLSTVHSGEDLPNGLARHPVHTSNHPTFTQKAKKASKTLNSIHNPSYSPHMSAAMNLVYSRLKKKNTLNDFRLGDDTEIKQSNKPKEKKKTLMKWLHKGRDSGDRFEARCYICFAAQTAKFCKYCWLCLLQSKSAIIYTLIYGHLRVLYDVELCKCCSSPNQDRLVANPEKDLSVNDASKSRQCVYKWSVLKLIMTNCRLTFTGQIILFHGKLCAPAHPHCAVSKAGRERAGK